MTGLIGFLSPAACSPTYASLLSKVEQFLPQATSAAAAGTSGATAGNTSGAASAGQNAKVGALLLGAAGVLAGAMMV